VRARVVRKRAGKVIPGPTGQPAPRRTKAGSRIIQRGTSASSSRAHCERFEMVTVDLFGVDLCPSRRRTGCTVARCRAGTPRSFTARFRDGSQHLVFGARAVRGRSDQGRQTCGTCRQREKTGCSSLRRLTFSSTAASSPSRTVESSSPPSPTRGRCASSASIPTGHLRSATSPTHKSTSWSFIERRSSAAQRSAAADSDARSVLALCDAAKEARTTARRASAIGSLNRGREVIRRRGASLDHDRAPRVARRGHP
jgi:hypothetical protein